MDLANYLENAVLDELFNSVQAGLTAVTSTTVHLHTGDPGEAGTANEVSAAVWTNYAAKTVNTDNLTSPFWNPAAAGLTDNNGDVDFGTATILGADPTVQAVSVRDQAGNVLFKGPMWSGPGDFVGTAADDRINAPGHGRANDEKVIFVGSALPTGLSEYTEYFVINATTDDFQVSTTQGGAAVDLTADGVGRVGKSGFKVISDGDPVKIATGALDMTLD